MEATIRAATLATYFDVARALKLNLHSLLRESGLDPTLLTNPEQAISAKAFVWLLEQSAMRSGQMNFGLRMAEERKLSDLGMIGMLLAHRRTLRDALLTAIEYRQSMSTVLAIDLEDDGNTVIIREEVLPVLGAYSVQATELAVGILASTCKSLLDDKWRPYAAYFTHPAPADLSVHRRMFACELRFDSEFNGITCASKDLDGPNPHADPQMLQQLEQSVLVMRTVNPDSFFLATHQAILLLMPLGRATIERVAAHMRVSTRTLQRRLDEDDYNFSKLVNEVRCDLAVRYLANLRYSIENVATLLGYTNQSAFGRWFKYEFGSAPTKWRATEVRRRRFA